MGICRRNLPWVFCICKQNLFCVCEQILFIWKQTFFTCEQNVFICEIFFINSVPFCYCGGSYGPPYMVMVKVRNSKQFQVTLVKCQRCFRDGLKNNKFLIKIEETFYLFIYIFIYLFHHIKEIQYNSYNSYCLNYLINWYGRSL